MLLEKTYEFIPPNAAEKVCLYIFEHLDENFIFSRTYDEIQKDTGVSRPTINRVFQKIENEGLVKHVGKSKWSFADIMVGWSNVCDKPGIFIENKGP